MSGLLAYAERFLPEYRNFPQGRYVSLVLVRKTESDALFRTEGAGEDLNREFVRAGLQDDAVIQRVVITKRKQTAVERRTGRELLRAHGLLHSKDDNSGECALNRNNACERCLDCMIYGYAVGGGGAQKSRVVTDDAFSVLAAGGITGRRTGNALYDNSTMRDPVTGKASQAIYEDPYVRPEVHFLEVETLRDVTLGEWVYVLGNILRSTRYGAISSRQGRMRNTLAAVVFSDCEVFSNLELVQAVHDRLRLEPGGLDHPLSSAAVLSAVSMAVRDLLPRVVGAEPLVVDATGCSALTAAVQHLYRAPERVGRLLQAVELAYAEKADARERGLAEVARLVGDAEREAV